MLMRLTLTTFLLSLVGRTLKVEFFCIEHDLKGIKQIL
jgi:hypothetical protein